MNATRLPLFVFLLALATTLTGCDAIAGIFKAGAITGIIAVVVVLALLFFIVNKMRGPRS
jgi:predicted small secreted protein